MHTTKPDKYLIASKSTGSSRRSIKSLRAGTWKIIFIRVCSEDTYDRSLVVAILFDINKSQFERERLSTDILEPLQCGEVHWG